MFFWFWLPLSVALFLLVVISLLDGKTDRAAPLAGLITIWVLSHLLLLIFAHNHRIEDPACERAYVEHKHFDFMLHPFLHRSSPSTDYDSYTCESELETKQADSSTSVVSVPLK